MITYWLLVVWPVVLLWHSSVTVYSIQGWLHQCNQITSHGNNNTHNLLNDVDIDRLVATDIFFPWCPFAWLQGYDTMPAISPDHYISWNLQSGFNNLSKGSNELCLKISKQAAIRMACRVKLPVNHTYHKVLKQNAGTVQDGCHSNAFHTVCSTPYSFTSHWH